MTLSWWKRLLLDGLVALFLPVFLTCSLLPARRPRLLVWGSAPLLANRYWSAAMQAGGRRSMTIMNTVYGINRREDFDMLFEDFAPRILPRAARFAVGTCLALCFVLRRASVLHTSFWGFALTQSRLWRIEGWLFRLAGVKVVVIPFGADAYLYSATIDTSLRYGLLASYPGLARLEARTRRHVDYWNRHADIVIAGPMLDGLGRWDVTMNQTYVIDTGSWTAKSDHSGHDGITGPVRILHTPNHRGFKGTEFLAAAVETLRSEGLQVELRMLEKVPNEEVRRIMQEVDILAEQFLFTGYAMSGIEGMASGLPVLANLEHDAYTRVYRRFGFLDECPILSTTPETLADNLRALVRNPPLRRELGRAGRLYVEKYHSYEMAQFLFGAIEDKLLGRSDADLINLFHPLKSDYNRRRPRVAHPLVESKLPAGWGEKHDQEAR